MNLQGLRPKNMARSRCLTVRFYTLFKTTKATCIFCYTLYPLHSIPCYTLYPLHPIPCYTLYSLHPIPCYTLCSLHPIPCYTLYPLPYILLYSVFLARYLTISSCISVRMSRYWARGKFGERERGAPSATLVSWGSRLIYSSLLKFASYLRRVLFFLV